MTVDTATMQWLATGLLSLVLWFSKRTIDEQRTRTLALELIVQNIRLEYLHKNEFKDFKAELRGMFEDLKKNLQGHNV